MYILKNALKSITRTPGRNILIIIIVVVIAGASCVALSIRNAANTAESQGLESLKITASIGIDRQAMMQKATGGTEGGGRDSMRQAMQNMGSLSIEDMQTYAAAESVEGFYYTLSSSVSASGDLEPVDTNASENTDTSSTSGNSQRGFDGGGGGAMQPPGGMGSQGDFTIIGYSSHAGMTDFISGTKKIADGAVFDEDSAEYTCIISKELATLNELSVGSTITLANPNQTDDDGTLTELYTFTVCGIYSTAESADSASGGMVFSTSSDPANQIYTSYTALKAVSDASAASAVTSSDESTGMTRTTALRTQSSGTYQFADKESYEAFEGQVRALGLSEDYTVTSTDLQNYESSLTPLKNLSSFATILLIIVLAVGAVILVVFNIFNIRERKYEVGVLTAIGMKKGKVAAQFIAELFLVTFAAVLIGAAGGAVLSVPVADKMLESQIAAQQSQATTQEQNFGRAPGGAVQTVGGTGGPSVPGGFGNRAVSYLSDIDAAVSLDVLLQLMGIGVLLTIVASCTGVVFILRYEPLKILSSRS